MASISHGYEYDIFISYRHNDNRGGWVTEFVNALQEELAAAIKEPVSIYFDQNPHDGLLETDNVDKSLEGKLKCLIFIPIISQTYCDPKSFAWQHEFVAFNKLVKEDQFGRDIKLKNGNVASRILPIKIHELDAEDKATIEKEIDSVLRGIEFIQKSGGVNRSLNAKDDELRVAGKILYRDQVNKVANAIKEIIHALKNNESRPVQPLRPLPKKKTKNIKSLVLNILVLTMVLLIGYFAYSRFIPSTKEEAVIDKSVAVLPFVDMSPEHDQEYFGDGVAEEIINVLAQTKDLKVISRSSSFQFKDKNEDLREIGKKLGVSTILEGSVRKFAGQVRVTAQLIKVSDGSHYWSKNMDQKAENLFEIQDAIAAEVASFLKASLFQGASSKEQEWNEEARTLYQKGRFFYDRLGDEDIKMAVEFLQRSVNLDSSHAISLVFLGSAYLNLQDHRKGDHYLLKAKILDPALPLAHTAQATRAYSNLDLKEAYNELSQALVNGKSDPLVLRTAAFFSWLSGNSKQAVEYARHAVEIDPLIGRSHVALIQALWANRDYHELLKSSLKAIELFPESQIFKRWHSKGLSMTNQCDSALAEINQIENIDFKTNAFIALYYQQKNFRKLDSIYKALPTDKQDAVDIAERLVINQKREEAIKLLIGTKMNQDVLASLRMSLILESLRGDRRFDDVMKKYVFPDELPSVN
jgi:adenylate cyclase